jgi:hypothetical protein
MTTDELARIASGSVGIIFWSWLIEKARRCLARRREQEGHTFLYSIGKKAGEFWSLCRQQVQRALRGWRV